LNISAICKIVSNKKIISKEVVAADDEIDGEKFQSDTIVVPTTAPVIHTEIVLNEEVFSNLNVAPADDVEIENTII